ncbi:class F sortase [Actinomadura decatromicini]|uniref:Class F sortase n=1 Tax=Actinomadura decatromicini TaxID=2604572 RepID=A0A5D3FZX0_9ACTN|nr:class F sortase [Actinomadura decatromicini]TYK53589.1 class F sortase [Actinomadura decatromicini]
MRGVWVLAAVLVAAGLVLVGLGLRGPDGPPQPPAWAAQTRTVDHRGPVLARSLPVEVAIPSIGVRAPLARLGLDADGAVQVPPAGRPDEAGWYDRGPTPGERGAAVILGHVDSAKGAAVFYDLGRLRPGDRVEVTRADGTTALFTVESVERVRKDRFPAERVYGPLGYPGLRLVTCGGTFDRGKRSYRDNIVVFAARTAVSPA